MPRPIESWTYISKFVYPEENLEEVSTEEKKDILLSKSKDDVLGLKPKENIDTANTGFSNPSFNKKQVLLQDPIDLVKFNIFKPYFQKFKDRWDNGLKIANEELENNTFTEMVGLWRARFNQDFYFDLESAWEDKSQIDRNHGSICKSCDLITAGGLSLALLRYAWIKKFNIRKLQGRLWATFFVIYCPYKILNLTFFSPSVEEMRAWHNYVPHSEKPLLHKGALRTDLDRITKAMIPNENLKILCPDAEIRYQNEKDYNYIKIPDRFKHERDYEAERAHNIRRFEAAQVKQQLIDESMKGDFSADYIMDKVMGRFNKDDENVDMRKLEEQDISIYLDNVVDGKTSGKSD